MLTAFASVAIRCPKCRRPLAQSGRLIAFRDEAGQHFVYEICERCAGRLDPLPQETQRRHLEDALYELVLHPGRYRLWSFADAHEAHAFCVLEADRLRAGILSTEST